MLGALTARISRGPGRAFIFGQSTLRLGVALQKPTWRGNVACAQGCASLLSSFTPAGVPHQICAFRMMSQSAERMGRHLPDKKRKSAISEEAVEEKHKRRQPPAEVAKRTESFDDEADFVSRVISVDSVRKTTKGGRVNRFRALVVCGNGKGAAGFATGKGESVRVAIQKAYHGAKKRWVAIDLSEDHGMYHDVMGKFNNTRVLIRSCKPYKGLVAGGVVRGVCDCFGIENATTKVIGRKTPSSVVYATFQALSKHMSPEEASELRGRLIVRQSRWEMTRPVKKKSS